MFAGLLGPFQLQQLAYRQPIYLMSYLDYSVSRLESARLRRRRVFDISYVQSLTLALGHQHEPEPVEVRPEFEKTEAQSGRVSRSVLIVSSLFI